MVIKILERELRGEVRGWSDVLIFFISITPIYPYFVYKGEEQDYS
jgi:hypothetical protein